MHPIKSITFSFAIVSVQVSALLLCLASLALANVTSSQGEVNLDVNNDGIHEMEVNSNGVGIGVSPSANLHVAGNAIITGNLSVGSSNPSSLTLNVSGSFGMNIEEVTGNVTLSNNSMVMAGNTSGNINVFLPHAESLNEGRLYTIKKNVSANEVIVRSCGNIEGASGVRLSSGNFGVVKVVSSSGNWYVLELHDGALSHDLPSVDISITQVDYEAYSAGSPYSKSFDVINCQAVLVVGAYFEVATAVLTDIDFGGQSPDGVINDERGYFFYFLDPPTASGQSLSFGMNASVVAVGIWELANVDMNGSVTPSLTDSIVTDKDNEFIVSCAWRNGDFGMSPTGDLSVDIPFFYVPGGGTFAGGSVTADTAGAYDVSWSQDDGEGGPAAFAFERK